MKKPFRAWIRLVMNSNGSDYLYNKNNWINICIVHHIWCLVLGCYVQQYFRSLHLFGPRKLKYSIRYQSFYEY